MIITEQPGDLIIQQSEQNDRRFKTFEMIYYMILMVKGIMGKLEARESPSRAEETLFTLTYESDGVGCMRWT